MRRLSAQCLLAVVLLLLWGGQALAHEVGVVLSLEPPVPPPGEEAVLTVQMVDPYGVPVPGTIRASAGPLDEPPAGWVVMTEGEPGIYTGRLRFPTGPVGVIRVEVELPDDQWHATFPVRLGEEWFQVSQVALELQPGLFGARQSQGAPGPGEAGAKPPGPGEAGAKPPGPGEAGATPPGTGPATPPWRWLGMAVAVVLGLLVAVWRGR